MRAKPVQLHGWGRTPVAAADLYRPERVSELAAILKAHTPLIARGGGRSYGDQALNTNGAVVLTTRLNRMLGFDETTGVLVAEPGVSFRDVLTVFGPRGWQVPVSPGTGYATLGGALANDVHGKNHDGKGAFGAHVVWFDLLLASGEVRRVLPGSDLFNATVGGMGLTGVVVALALTLMRVPSNAVVLREERVADLDDFLAKLIQARDASYSVGWIDALATGATLGRGVIETAEPAADVLPPARPRTKRIPVDFPSFALSAPAVRLFNLAYRHRVPAEGRERLVPVDRFLYPLDAIQDWNRIYGKRGFHQFQCVVPDVTAGPALRAMLSAIAGAGSASFLAVLKSLGAEGPGYLSFPSPGFTLALDFPHRAETPDLLARLEAITIEARGRIYLAKDSLAAPASIPRMYPKLDQFRTVLDQVDPHRRFVSDMARRLELRP